MTKGRRISKHGRKSVVVRVSEELFKEMQKYAIPLKDTFEDAVWKAIEAHKNG